MTSLFTHWQHHRMSVAFIGVLLCIGLFFTLTLGAQAQSAGGAGGSSTSTTPEITYEYSLTKKFSEEYPRPLGYTADQFTFDIVGTSDSGLPVSMLDISLTEYNDDSADAAVNLPVGSYTVTENGPNDFFAGEWTVQWSGYGCQNANSSSLSTSITVKADDPTANVCTADNQWRPANLTVEKNLVGTTTAYENFEFTVTQNATNRYDGPFDTDGINEFKIEAGDYSIVEKEYPGYTTTYENCEGTFVQGGSKTCTITNTYNSPNYSQSSYYSQGSYGGGGGNDPEYLVFGYVWHDENSNQCWEGTNCPAEEATTTEDDLTNWTVEITNGSTTHSTTTDAMGYYYFNVPAGSWTITEVLQNGWTKTFPIATSHTVEVGTELSAAENTPLFAQLWNMLIPTVFAQAPTTYGPFNFGNFFTGSSYSQGSYGGGYSQGSYGGGGSNAPRCRDFTAERNGDTVTLSWDTIRGFDLMIAVDDTEIFSTTDNDVVDEGTHEVVYTGNEEYLLTVTRGSRDDTCTTDLNQGGGTGGPSPEVLGEQVTTMPVGGANTGAGGASPVEIPRTPLIAGLLTLARRKSAWLQRMCLHHR